MVGAGKESMERDGERQWEETEAVFTDDQKYTITEFVKLLPELYTKENARYMDKKHKDALWNELGGKLGRTVLEARKWFKSQHSRCDKITRKLNKSGQGAMQMTGRAKWVIHVLTSW